MEITLEQVERLREKADVSYGQAKQALEYSCLLYTSTKKNVKEDAE